MKMGVVLPDVERMTSWGAPTLKVRGTMMACQAINKQAEPNTLVVCMPIADRDELIAADPDTYYLKPHSRTTRASSCDCHGSSLRRFGICCAWDGSSRARAPNVRLRLARRNQATPRGPDRERAGKM